MARRTRVDTTDYTRYLDLGVAADVLLYDAFFEALDYTDECDRCRSDASEHSVIPLRGGGFEARCNLCGHVNVCA